MAESVIETWRALLLDMGELGAGLCAAIEADDVERAIASMMQLRRVRSSLARVEATSAPCTQELAAIREVAALTARAHFAGDVMQHWLERTLPGDARLLETALGTAALADSLLPPVWDFDADLVILVGETLGGVAEILADLGQRRIIVYGGGPRSPAIGVESREELVAAIRTLVPSPPAQLVVRAAFGSDPEEVEQIAKAAREALSDLRIHRNTVRAFSRVWLEQGIANLHAIAAHPSVAAADHAFVGKPMVIVAPGPSLARNVELLRDSRGRAIVCAFSHSLEPLLAAGVVPDLVVTVDPQDVRYHFAGCDVSRSYLVNAVTVHPALFELPAAGYLTLSANGSIDDWLFEAVGEHAVVPGGGSVATTAFSLALRWGCDPIIVVGLDLSFPGGNYYVASSSDGQARATVDANGMMRVQGWSSEFHRMKAAGGPAAAAERAIELPGWHGGTVPSSFMFGLFHRWFVDRMKAVAGVTVYNCTEGGAWIDGMIHRRLADVLPQLDGSVDVEATLSALDVQPAMRRRRIDDYLAYQIRRLQRADRLARRARSMIARGETGLALQRVESALARIIERAAFASLLAQCEVERAEEAARRDCDEHGYLRASMALLATLTSVIDQLVPALVAARGHLVSKGALDG